MIELKLANLRRQPFRGRIVFESPAVRLVEKDGKVALARKFPVEWLGTLNRKATKTTQQARPRPPN